MDSRTNRIAWQNRTPYSIGQGSGALTTAGGLLFHGEPDGNFQAYDARTGQLLWHWQTGAGADAPAITYEVDGEQYVAIATGGLAVQVTSANGDMIWAFSLEGSRRYPIGQFDPPGPPPMEVSFEFTGSARGEEPIIETNEVDIFEYTFAPLRITIPKGTKVTFANRGNKSHNVTASKAGGFNTGLLEPGESAVVAFDMPGTYFYTCALFPFMIGQITVTPEASVERGGRKTDVSNSKNSDP